MALDRNAILMIENLADKWNDRSVSPEEIVQELDRIQFDTLGPEDFEEIEEVYKNRIKYIDDSEGFDDNYFGED